MSADRKPDEWFDAAWREYEEVTRPVYQAKLQAWKDAGGFGPPPPHPVRPHIPGYYAPRKEKP